MLPKAIEEFKTKEYWEKFFEKRGEASFEWYGSYNTYKEILKKEITPKSRVLMLGCGNSLMSEQMYDDGYQNIESIDYSEKVIATMEARKKDRKINYTVMDATDLKYPSESFDAIIDKGALDAMFCNEASDTISTVEKVWENCFKVLSNKGKYICITLLQQHVLAKIFSYFLNGNHNPVYADRAFIIRIYEAEADLSSQSGQKHVPFVVIVEQSKLDTKSEAATKIKDLFSKTVYYISQKMETLTIDSAIRRVKERQMLGFVINQSKSFEKGQRFRIECYDPTSKLDLPKYIMAVVDSKNEKILRKKTCGVFIAPLGRENDYLFATEEGNFYLQSEYYFR